MSWNDYPALGERCYLETLPNGLRLRVVPKPASPGNSRFSGSMLDRVTRSFR